MKKRVRVDYFRIGFSLILLLIMLAGASAKPLSVRGNEGNEDEVDVIAGSILSVRDAVAGGGSLKIATESEKIAKSGIVVENAESRQENVEGKDVSLFLSTWDKTVEKADSILKEEKEVRDDLYESGAGDYDYGTIDDELPDLTEGTGRGDDGDRPRVTTRRFYVAKGKSVTTTLRSSSRLSVAVVPEVGGLVSMRLHAHNHHGFDSYFDDTEKYYQGKSYRKKQLKLPASPTTVEVEVFNRSPKDISYILITK